MWTIIVVTRSSPTAMADDPLADYNSEEDEDYVPDWSNGDDDDERAVGGVHGHPVSGNARGKKRAAAAAALPTHARVSMLESAKRNKRKAAPRIGAAVLSDDDEEDLFHVSPPPPPPAPVVPPSSSSPPAAPQSRGEQKEDASTTEAHAHGASDDVAVRGVGETAEASSTTSAALAAPQLPPIVASSAPPSAPAAAAASVPAVPGGGAAHKKSDNIASILAQFNKKTAKPAAKVKKVINPWERPVQPQAAPTATAPAAADPPSGDAAAANGTSTSAGNGESAAPASSTMSSPPSAAVPSAAPSAPSAAAESSLSTERVVVTDFTSYAGEALAVTRTLIKGSADERAYRAARRDPLAALVSSLGAKREINTLEKSRLDWSRSKAEEGDEEELKAFVDSKDALVDRMAFLAKAERRQWEKQKETRDEARRQTTVKSTAGMDED